MIDRTVKFPQIGDVSSTQSYVLVGANGSGKSHLGAWIEKNNDKVLRISAQRALSISSKGNKGEDIQNDLNNHISEIDVNAIFVQTETNISDIIAERDYKKMLNVFNHKGMCQRVTGIIGLKKKYPQVVLDLIKGEKRDEIISALLGYLPKID